MQLAILSQKLMGAYAAYARRARRMSMRMAFQEKFGMLLLFRRSIGLLSGGGLILLYRLKG